MSAPRHLVVLIRRPGFDEGLVAPHIAFLEALRAQGLLELSGGFADSSGGAYLLRGVPDLAAARGIAQRDPLVVHGASDLTVHEWNAR